MENTDSSEAVTARQDIRRVMDQVRNYPRPVVSLYATVDPGQRETLSQPVAVRAKNTLKEMSEVPEDVRRRVLDYFDSRRPRARSIALFASAEELDVLELDVVFEDDATSDRLNGHFGEPHFAPLLAAMQDHAAHIAVFADRDHVRVFHVFMGQAELLLDEARETTAGEQDEIGQSKGRLPEGVKTVAPPNTRSPHTASSQHNGPKYIADRGDAAKQLNDERIEYSQQSFYRRCGEQLQSMLEEREVAGILVFGPERDRHLMHASMPGLVAKHVTALLPGTERGLPESSAVVGLVEPNIAGLGEERGAELLDAIAERGVRGLEESLAALQEGRLHRLAVPTSLSVSAYRDERTDYVTTRKRDASTLGDGDATEVDLASVLPELAEKWGARLEYSSGEQEQRLLEDFGGLAGLRRW